MDLKDVLQQFFLSTRHRERIGGSKPTTQGITDAATRIQQHCRYSSISIHKWIAVADEIGSLADCDGGSRGCSPRQPLIPPRLSVAAAYAHKRVLSRLGEWIVSGYHSVMHYFIYGIDHPDSLAGRLAARPAHLARLQLLCDQGRLLSAGPLPAIDSDDPGPAGFTGSVIIAEFASLQDARDWADADPYLAQGVYREVVVKPFRKVLP